MQIHHEDMLLIGPNVDVTVQRARDRAATLGARDDLTGLHNRKSSEMLLMEAHDLAFTSGVPYSLLVVDIDHLKTINKSNGYEAGDATIRVVANLLSSDLRAKDSICRWEGDKFLCILKEATETIAANVAERIRRAIEAVMVLDVGHISVSIGVATWTPSSADAANLVKAADQKLLEAKQRGRNQVVYIFEFMDVGAIVV